MLKKIEKKPNKILVVLSVILVLINTYLGWFLVASKYRSNTEIILYSLGAILMPILVVALFQLFKKFRNNSSRLTIFLWISFFVFVEKVYLLFMFTGGGRVLIH